MTTPDATTRGYCLTEDADLRTRNTFGVSARAPLLVEVDDAAVLPALFDDVLAGRDVLALGGGSNLLFAGNARDVVLALGAANLHVVVVDGDKTTIRADAGVGWHACVQWTLANGLAGFENLALIPGTVGAAPIQNIGAYGVEVGDHIVAVEAFDRNARALRRIEQRDCAFAYRDSRFKREPDRWIVTAVEFALSRTPSLRLDYTGIAEELAAMHVDAPTPALVAEAVCRIRRRKLPDPVKIGNAGSFFKNPVVDAAHAQSLKSEHPRLPVFPVTAFPVEAGLHGASGNPGTRKLSAAWLIDACGWKGHRDGDAAVSSDHALVLVNHGDASGLQLLELARRISASVQARFGVALEPEPRIVGAAW